MRRILFAVLFVLLAPAGAHAAEYKSSFGFPFSLSDDWVVMQPKDVSRQYDKQTLTSLGLTEMDPESAKATLARVKAGKVEFYFEKKYSAKGFNNNISAQVMAGGDIPTPDEVKAFCPSLPEQAAREQGAPVRVMVCRFAKSNGIPYVAVEYAVPSRGVTIIQHQIPYLANSDFQIVGGANDAGLDTVRAAADALTASVTRYIAGVWAAKPPGPAGQAALVKDAMHRFALAVNARDFTGFYGYISDDWRRNVTVAQLDGIYKAFMDNDLNLLPLDHVTPKLENVPQQGRQGMFFVKGYYPTRPLMVTFEFGYLYEPPNWKLVKAGIQVKTVH